MTIRYCGVYPGERWPSYWCRSCDALYIRPETLGPRKPADGPLRMRCPGCGQRAVVENVPMFRVALPGRRNRKRKRRKR